METPEYRALQILGLIILLDVNEAPDLVSELAITATALVAMEITRLIYRRLEK